MAGIALVLAIAQDGRTDAPLLLIGCLAATVLMAALSRRSAPGPTLAGLGAGIALVAAWLVPQRAAPVSALLLALMFGVGAGLATAPPSGGPASRWTRL